MIGFENTAKILDVLGLSNYELRMYAAALELGRATAARIAKRAGIPRTSAYPVLEKLSELGLISIEQSAGAQRFIAAAPESLVLIAEERLENAQEAVNASKELAEALRSRYRRDALSSSKILIFEGKKSVRQWMYDWEEIWRESIIDTGRFWIGFQDHEFLDHYGEWVTHYWHKYHRAKGWEKDKVHLFATGGATDTKVKKSVEPVTDGRRILRPLPSDFPFTATVWVIGEYLAVLKTREQPHYALQIRDSILTENMFSVFQFLWSLTE